MKISIKYEGARFDEPRKLTVQPANLVSEVRRRICALLSQEVDPPDNDKFKTAEDWIFTLNGRELALVSSLRKNGITQPVTLQLERVRRMTPVQRAKRMRNAGECPVFAKSRKTE
jgi:hypothetical protein